MNMCTEPQSSGQCNPGTESMSMETESEESPTLTVQSLLGQELMPPEPAAKKPKMDEGSNALDLDIPLLTDRDMQLETQTILSTIVEPPSTCHSIVGTEDSKTTTNTNVNGASRKGRVDVTALTKDDDDTPVYLGSVFDQPRATDPVSILPDGGGNNGDDGGVTDGESDIEIVFEQQNLEMAKNSGVPVDRTKIRVNLVHFQQAKKRLCEVLENYRRLEAVGLENLLILLPTCLPMLLNVVRQVTPVERMERLLSLQAVQPFGQEEQKCILDYLYENFHEYHEGNQAFANYMEMILMPELTVRLYALVNHISVEQAENEMFKIMGVLNYGLSTPWMEQDDAQEEKVPETQEDQQLEDPLSITPNTHDNLVSLETTQNQQQCKIVCFPKPSRPSYSVTFVKIIITPTQDRHPYPHPVRIFLDIYNLQQI
ncbi:unnamed protein product [Allacma fusca]|uniref:Uncharacterized protein n=1 Tax=Allacma fusca TaxID=39272 RepID=A0A8J2NTY7_9HEXA|nr:unnamed protein product [Allacma fusca]